MAKKNYFDGELNEYIDWVLGIDSTTGSSQYTKGLAASGGAIRRLLMDRLQHPLYIFKDTEANLYRFFSSKTAYQKWKAAIETHDARLEKELAPFFEIERPAPYFVGVSDDSVSLPKYLIKGDIENAPLIIKPTITNTAGITQNDSITAKFERLLGDNVVETFELKIDGAYVNNNYNPYVVNLFEYLKDGLNYFRITLKADTEEAKDYSFFVTYYYIDFTLSCSFNYATGIEPNDLNDYEGGSKQIRPTVTIYKSINESARIKVYYEVNNQSVLTVDDTFDGNTKTYNPLIDTSSCSPSEPKNIENTSEEDKSYTHRRNSLKIYAELILGAASGNDSDLSYSTFRSNYLYYDFEVRSYNYGAELANNFINIYKSTNTYVDIDVNGKPEFALVGTQYTQLSFNYAYYTDTDISLTGGLSSAQKDIIWKLEKTTGGEIEYEDLGTTVGYNGIQKDPFVFTPSNVFNDKSNAFIIAYVTDLQGNLVEVRRVPLIVNASPLQVRETDGYALKLTTYGKSNEIYPDNWEDLKRGIKAKFSANFPFNNSCGWNNNALVIKGVTNACTISYNPFGTGWYVEGATSNNELGCTIQLDFMTEDTNSNDDVLMYFGNSNYGVIIKPTAAQVVKVSIDPETHLSTNEIIIETNYKTNERIHLTFIFHPSTDPIETTGLVYIVNNGILERAASYGGGSSFIVTSGNITIGGPTSGGSGIRIYGLRCYKKSITTRQALDNFIYDQTSNKAVLLNRNELSDPISYAATSKILPTLLISGDLTQILDKEALKDQSESTVNIIFKNPKDKTKDFVLTNGRVRKHGQSTLNYPITSMKLWFNKSAEKDAALELITTFECASQEHFDLNKNRYIMKTETSLGKRSVPSNKFVLQANYADSSGVHNGGILRLINDTWYKAQVKISNENDNKEYKLRNNPQLFTSNTVINHNNEAINERSGWETTSSTKQDTYDDGTPYTKNVFTKKCKVFRNGQWVMEDIETVNVTNGVEGYNDQNKLWNNYSTVNGVATEFPYTIRTGPDSFPCAVFYENTKDPSQAGVYRFLGTYVFMDDKKSDFIFGERSIFGNRQGTGFLSSDPFCLTTSQKDDDISNNRVWNNKHVLRIECVLVNTKLTSFMDYYTSTKVVLDTNPESPTYNEYIESGDSVLCDDIKYEDGQPSKYYWEDYFEMIYPDEDDIKGHKIGDPKKNGNGVYTTDTTKFGADSEFKKTAQPFVDLLYWLGDLGSRNTTTGRRGGPRLLNGQVNPDILEEFKQTASSHLDLYKLAAYYIFYLRFGLVDSVERNAQLKTYDGIHWHFEPWDMDIALGNKNDGGIAFEPPMTRDTRMPGDETKYAFSGRSSSTSNFLWDCLEAWDHWSEVIVPNVAQALYDAGLTYDNISDMFDNEYVAQWPEHMYNESGTFKYITMRGTENGWLAWLQGARTSHRHWWLSTSMNYYDAKWSCGDFNNHRIYIAADKAQGVAGLVKIKPISETYFKLTVQDGSYKIPGYCESDGPSVTYSTVHATKNNYAMWDITGVSFAVKDPAHIFGATFIEELDVSAFATGITSLTLGGAYDKILGASIKVLNVGVPFYMDSAYNNLINFNDTLNLNNVTTIYGRISSAKLNLSGSSSKKSILSMDDEENTGNDSLKNLITLNINGQKTVKDTESLLKLNDRRNVENFYAIGTTLTRFENAPSGNKFNNLFLPASMTGVAGNSNITSLTFNDCSWNNLLFWNTNVTGTIEYITTEDGEGGTITYQAPNPATFTKTRVPASITSITFNGSTAAYECSAHLFKNWVDSIEQAYNNSISSIPVSTLYNNLRAEWILNDKLLDEAYPIEDTTTGTRKTIASNGTSAYLYNLLLPETPILTNEEIIELGLLLYIKQSYNFVAKNINWDDTYGITFSYLKKLAFFNNGSNADTKIITGYIKMAGDTNLTPNQLSELSTWFGNSVFDISAIKTSLVIDHGNNYLAISIGTGSFIENGNIFVNESDKVSNRVIIKANKFTLKKNITGLNYKWTVYDVNNNISSKVSITTNRNTGVSYIYAKEGNGTGGDYKVRIRADFYEDPALIEMGGQSSDFGEIEIWIRPVTRPTGWNVTFNKRGNSTSIRVLNALPHIFSEFFGDSNKTHVINGFEVERPNYILYSQGLEYEIQLSAVGESNATINNFGWTIENINIGDRGFDEFTKVGEPPLISYSTNSNSQLALDDPTPITFAKQIIDDSTEDILYYKKDSSKGLRSGIVIGSYENKNWNFNYKAFKVTCTIGYTVPEKFIMNILVIDDAKPLLKHIDQKIIYNTLLNKIINSGGIKQSTDDLYKVDLMCVDGNIIIDGNNSIMSYDGLEVNASPNSVFYYLPNVTGVKLDNCSNLYVPEDNSDSYFIFDNMKKLKALSLKNLSANSVGTLDLSKCTQLEYVNTKLTNTGVILPYSIKVAELGHPTQISISNTSGFDINNFSVEGTDELKSLEILNVNRESGNNNAYGYKLLYKLANKPTTNANSTDYFSISNDVYIWYLIYEDINMSAVISRDSGTFNKHWGCCWYQSQLSSIRGKKINIFKFKAAKAGTINIYKTTSENVIANNKVAEITITSDEINTVVEKHVDEFILGNNEYLIIGKYGENIIEYDDNGHSSITGVTNGDTANIYYKNASGPGFYSNIKFDYTTPNWDRTWSTNSNCELNIGVGYFYTNN